ncbi:hypothetical protein Tco_0825707 [Tanacetum coccineum]
MKPEPKKKVMGSLVDKKGGSYAAIAPKLESGKFNKWKKRILCYLAGIEPYYLKCIKDAPFQTKTAEGDAKPESQWTPAERRVVVQDQRLKSIIMSCLPDDIMEYVISCVSAKETWTDLVHSFKGPSDTKENRILYLKLEYQTFRANLPEKWLTFSQGLRNSNHTQTLDLADIYERQVLKLQNPKYLQPKNKGLVVETFDEEEVTQVKVLMALADDELTIGKSHARNGEWVDITWKVPESQAVNESLEISNILESSKDSEAESLTPLPPLKIIQGASPSAEILIEKAKLFPQCTYCGFNDHIPDDCRNYLSVESVEAMITLPQDTIVLFRLEEEY